MPILEQRGVFWWHDEALPDGVLAPDSSVAGTCRIEDNGRTVLELDGYLPGPHGPMAAAAQGPVTTCVQGLLKGANERILLSDLVRSGGRFSSNGISFERYVAMDCLIGQTTFAAGAQAPVFDTLEIPLDGFEEWLGLGTIRITRTEDNISAGYEKPDDITYPCEGGSLGISFGSDVDESGTLGTYAFSLKQTALLRLHLNQPIPLKDLRLQYGMLEDLLKLLTDSDYVVDWPWISMGDGSRHRWYCTRVETKKRIAAPEYYNTITRFPDVREQFGQIWSSWNTKREEFGAGFYLYLGTRRGLTLYVEHRFVNLIWGLEAFHRRKHDAVQSDALTVKIHRILEKITCTNDKRWLKRRLKDGKRCAGPTLLGAFGL